MKILFLLVFLFLVSSCGNQGDSDQEGNAKEEIDTTIYQRNLNVPNEEVVLQPEAREITMNWLAYLTAQSEIENFDNYTVNDVISNATPIAEIMENLRQSVPDSLKTNSIQTRVTVLYTKAKVLEHMAKRRSDRPEAIKATAEELPVDFNNFKLQINELFLKTLEDFEKELDDFQPEEDTLSLPRQILPPTGIGAGTIQDTVTSL
ncbi:hypothetical protein FHG64_11035 [Antarcticibacterium flavum]|uniref:Lipoprotein n=1 Tax=Antarcticibacterium flavum TaxID=2058175 RepID=A0A5B7X3Q4_9FLAO|nr:MULTISPECIES: hypothetical protein [Antarcticibacterium]QCY69890.1 hypothetical protein FHG64_11035 [Antarcticibacterium flavum]